MIAPPSNDAPGVVVVIAQGDVHAQRLADGDPRQVAHVPRRKHIGRTIQIGHAIDEPVKIAARAVTKDHSLRA